MRWNLISRILFSPSEFWYVWPSRSIFRSIQSSFVDFEWIWAIAFFSCGKYPIYSAESIRTVLHSKFWPKSVVLFFFIQKNLLPYHAPKREIQYFFFSKKVFAERKPKKMPNSVFTIYKFEQKKRNIFLNKLTYITTFIKHLLVNVTLIDIVIVNR